MNVFKNAILSAGAICLVFPVSFAATAKDKTDPPAWVEDCEGYLSKAGDRGYCAVGISESSDDEFYARSEARRLARVQLGTKAGSLVFKAVEKSGCWSSGMAPSVAVIKVSESATEREKEWFSKDNRCHTFLKMNLRGFQKTVYRTCGLPDDKDKKIYDVAKEVWKAHFGQK